MKRDPIAPAPITPRAGFYASVLSPALSRSLLFGIGTLPVAAMAQNTHTGTWAARGTLGSSASYNKIVQSRSVSTNTSYTARAVDPAVIPLVRP